MGEKTFIKILIAVFFVFWSSLFLESKLTIFVVAEMGFLIIALLVAIIVLYAIHNEKRWAFPLTTLFFSIMVINLIVLFLGTDYFIVFILGSLFAVYGIVVSTRAIIPSVIPYKDVQTYKIKAPKQANVRIITTKKKITKKKKATKKKKKAKPKKKKTKKQQKKSKKRKK